jgi:cystathionine beta-lyase
LKDDTLPAARRFVSSTRLFRLAESLGGIKSLISHSAEMTHKTIPPEIRKAAGVQDSLIRLSVGLEEAEDLISDLRNTFDRMVVRSNKVLKRLENC